MEGLDYEGVCEQVANVEFAFTIMSDPLQSLLLHFVMLPPLMC